MDRMETTHADGHPGPPRGIRRVTLYRYRQSSGLARDQVEHFMISAMRRPDLVDDACAVVGEMVANVINHTKSARFWLTMLPNHGSPLIEVWDGSPSLPCFAGKGRTGPPDFDALTGRGLYIVRSLAADCGAYVLDRAHGGGKIVWARFE